MVAATIKRLIREDAGMEMVEWSIVGMIFAIASALVWTTMKTTVDSAVVRIGQCVGDSSFCP
jgi:hypothetical protein